MYTGYNLDELNKLINYENAKKLRNELRRRGEVLPATKDVVFKNLMINSHLFLSIILEHFLGIDRKIIKNNMRIENTVLPVSNAKEKKKVTDIIVRVEKNVVNLEMNASYYEGLINRNIDYILKAKTEANFSGENYDDNYIGIQINFDLDWQYDDREIIKFVLMDPERGIVLSKNLIIYNINLLKFQEKYYNDNELSEFERAITLLTLTKREDIEKISEGVEGLMEAKEEIKKLSNNLGIIGVYDYEKHKEWEWKQKAKEYVKDDLALIDSLKEEIDISKKQNEEEKKTIEEDKKIIEEDKKIIEEDKKIIEEDKKSIEEDKKIIEEDKKSIEEDKKSIEEDKKSIEEDKKSIEEDKKTIEEEKKSLEKEKKELAKRMLVLNLSIDDIIKTTGLSKKEIQELKKY